MCGRILCVASLLVASSACQDYPFESRARLQTNAVEIQEVIRTVQPTDIIFVVDNSGSMLDELEALRSNLRTFFELLGQSQNDYRVGFITPDVECNVPERTCGAFGTSSTSCCNVGPPPCEDKDINGDGTLDATTCDGGRFRSVENRSVISTEDRGRFFDRPPDDRVEAWLNDIDRTLLSLGCEGSGYEATLEALRRAVVCSLSTAEREAAGLREVDSNGDLVRDACPDPKVAQLNAGFIRPEADLVIIFISDEDDCSFSDALVAGEDPTGTSFTAVPTAYQRPTNPNDPTEQAIKLCSPHECYGYVIADWIEGNPSFRCAGQARLTMPPDPEPIDVFFDDIVKAKGSVSKIRGGGILGGLRDPSAVGPTAFRKAACFYDATGLSSVDQQPGPGDGCGCWANGASDMYCQVTGVLGQQTLNAPITDDIPLCGGGTQPSPGGCEAMTGGRLVDFLNLIGERRLNQSLDPFVLADSICQPQYDSTIRDIVNTIFLNNCYELGVANLDPSKIQVRLNGNILQRVEPPTVQAGWTQQGDESRICLLNLNDIEVGDRFEIFLLTDN